MQLRSKFFLRFTAGICSLVCTASLAQAAPSTVRVEGSASPTYAEVESIIADNCQACHTGGADQAVAGVSLDNEAEVLSQAKRVYDAIDSGLMPYGDSEWRTSPDGVKLLSYLQSVVTP